MQACCPAKTIFIHMPFLYTSGCYDSKISNGNEVFIDDVEAPYTISEIVDLFLH